MPRVVRASEPPVLAILEVLVGHGGEEAVGDDAPVSGPPRIHVHARDGGDILRPCFPDGYSLHCPPVVVCWALALDRVIGDGRIGGAAAAILLFTVFSPTTLVEEVYSRGFLLNKHRQITGFWRADLASSVLFGLIHVPGWIALGRFATPFVAVDFVGLVVVGMLFGWAMMKTGSLWSAYALHALHNLLVVSVLSP